MIHDQLAKGSKSLTWLHRKVDGTKRRATNMEVELEGEVAKEVGQIED